MAPGFCWTWSYCGLCRGDHSFADQILSLFSLTIVIMSPGLCFYQRCAGHVNCSDQKPEEVTTSMFVLQQISLPGKTFSHFFCVCILMVAIPTLSIPEIISCGKDLIFLILIIFLVAVAIFCQWFCIWGWDRMICSKCLFPSQFL